MDKRLEDMTRDMHAVAEEFVNKLYPDNRWKCLMTLDILKMYNRRLVDKAIRQHLASES